MRTVALALLAYLVGFVLFWPTVPAVRDEVKYLEQATMLAAGDRCVAQVDALTGVESCDRPAVYLPGTATFMLPAVAALGWSGGRLAPVAALLIAVLALAFWLRSAGRSPWFALMLLAYPSALIFGRIAMSDLPSTALAAVGLWLFFTGGAERPGRWIASGFVAGLSLSVRETNVLVFAPLFFGALVRREPGLWRLILGGLAGSALRPLGTWWVFGDPMFVFQHGPAFGLANLLSNAPIYGLALLIYVPAGAIGAFAYRGERRPEVLATLGIYLSLYLFYGYTGAESGLLKQLVLGPRYVLPLVPLVVFAASESFTRWFADAWNDRPALRGVVTAWAVGVGLLAFAVHPAIDRYTHDQEATQRAIYEATPEGAVLVINDMTTRKYVNRLRGGRAIVYRKRLGPRETEALLARYGEIWCAFVDRPGTPLLQTDTDANRAFLVALERMAEVEQVVHQPGGGGETLSVYRARAPRPVPDAG